jgi:hypothetical protein
MFGLLTTVTVAVGVAVVTKGTLDQTLFGVEYLTDTGERSGATDVITVLPMVVTNGAEIALLEVIALCAGGGSMTGGA